MGLFGNSGGNAPNVMAGLGARLGQALRSGGAPQADNARGNVRPRGNTPNGLAGLGARLGQRLRGR